MLQVMLRNSLCQIQINKTAVEIEWILETPVREDIYEYIINC